MATVTLAAGKKPGSTGSKNNKKAWRKTDITVAKTGAVLSFVA